MAMIVCPYCNMPDWRSVGLRHRGRENSVYAASCNNCGKIFYIFRTRLGAYSILMEQAEKSHGDIPHLLE